ncbi:hypothetical protein cce_3273 [Crocosphaera subtropica ATCC 51142]|uniref:Uncharacterized protein n=1 Tax=Crocosphaera subtropica (strain ATCC 51142 / BH68) TaxID=43989 RepID=B1WY37_CROS5|nr:hypothetical protein cce_3273 [Crocosphaera subtropica ATCC 51142]
MYTEEAAEVQVDIAAISGLTSLLQGMTTISYQIRLF